MAVVQQVICHLVHIHEGIAGAALGFQIVDIPTFYIGDGFIGADQCLCSAEPFLITGDDLRYGCGSLFLQCKEILADQRKQNAVIAPIPVLIDQQILHEAVGRKGIGGQHDGHGILALLKAGIVDGLVFFQTQTVAGSSAIGLFHSLDLVTGQRASQCSQFFLGKLVLDQIGNRIVIGGAAFGRCFFRTGAVGGCRTIATAL